MTKIRRLSSPDLDELDDSRSYDDVLCANFKRIGELATQNRSILAQDIMPLLQSKGELSEEQAAGLRAFTQQIVDASFVESLDAPLTSLVTDRLVEDAEAKGDKDYLVEQLDAQIVDCYTLMHLAMRITCTPSLAMSFRNKGLDAARRLVCFLKKDEFAQLSNDSRAMVLTNARYAAVLFESTAPTPELNARSLEMLERALHLEEDEFYRTAVDDFDWDYFRVRTLEYYAMSCDIHNVRGFDNEQIRRICEKGDKLNALLHDLPSSYTSYLGKSEGLVIQARNHYFAKDISRREYQRRLLDIYSMRDKRLFTGHGCYENLLVPLEYLLATDPSDLHAHEKNALAFLYEDVCEYAKGIAREHSLGFVLEYFTLILENFVEVPGAMTFEEVGLRCLAALHPPTYVHSTMVALLTQCLTKWVVRLRPELLVGMLETATPGEVAGREDELVAFAYRAARCHDFGKLALIDTIFVYGRNLLDFEFSLIKEHPTMGARLLEAHASTKPFADAALLHHLWHDRSAGYPLDARQAACQGFVDIVACTDCMDAATDPVGRSYRNEKTLDQYLDEVREGAGTRYAGWLPGILERPEVYDELNQILHEERENVYGETYRLLSGK